MGSFRIRIAALFLLSFPVFAQVTSNRVEYLGGKYVEIQGGHFFLDCYGRGAPTVLLWSGQGGGFLDWLLVQPDIAKRTRVCSFDPAGFGRSAGVPSDDTFEGGVRTLHEALARVEERGPFVLVGQSVGGIEARVFQHLYPERVEGLVLVDSYEFSAPFQGKTVPMYTLSAEQLRSTLPDRSHSPRPSPPAAIEPPFAKLPKAAQEEHLEDVRQMLSALDFRKEPEVMESFRRTFVMLHQESLAPNVLHGLPLFVITRDGVSPPEEQLQQSYLRLSSHSQRRIASKSGHFVQLDAPSVVIAAIGDVLDEQKRSGKR